MVCTIFSNLGEAKNIINSVAKLLPKNNPYYEDFQFFSSNNCTTSSEYREELKSFLEKFIIDYAILSMPENVKEIYPLLVKLYGWL